MMKLLKTITAFILLTGLLLPLVAPVVLQLQQRYVQWQMIEALEKKELVTITVDAVAVQWIRKGKECWINNDMFDIKHIAYSGGRLMLTGLFDKKEKQLKEQLQAQTNQQQQEHQKAQIVKLLLQYAAIHQTELINYNIVLIPGNHNSLFKNSCYQPPFNGTVTPPPRIGEQIL